jgi:hypothetical protein
MILLCIVGGLFLYLVLGAFFAGMSDAGQWGYEPGIVLVAWPIILGIEFLFLSLGAAAYLGEYLYWLGRGKR